MLLFMMIQHLKGSCMRPFITKTILLFAVLIITLPVLALTLTEAKRQGLLGEIPNGYLGVRIHTSESKSLANQVNHKRLTHFKKLAKKNGLTVAQVAELAGAKFIEKTSSGNFIMNSEGEWVKK